MTPTEQKAAAKRFVERWQQAEGNEQRESNSFWIELCGVAHLFELYAESAKSG